MISLPTPSFPLSFNKRCFSIESLNLLQFLSEQSNPCSGRRRKVSKEFIQALDFTVSALLLQSSVDKNVFLFRSMGRSNFKENWMTEQKVGYRPFKSVVEGLSKAGYLEVIKGYKETFNIHEKGIATRFRATEALISLASDHGIRLSDWSSHFELLPRPKTVEAPVQLRANNWKNRQGIKCSGGSMPVDLEDPAVIGFANQVNEINAFMAEQDIQPAEWHFAFSRIFGQGDLPDFNWNKGARLYSYGYGESYQQVKKAERKRLSINGEPIAEVDIQASYLTILHHLLGAPPPEADPYDIPGIPRGVVKIWVTITLGNNGFHHRWPKESKQRYAEQSKSEQADLERDHPFKSTQATILEHLPLLKDWPNCAVRWGDLQFLESCAVIDATHRLAMEYGIPALPLHDALLVPVSKANIAKEVLSECFYQKVGIRPKIAIK